MLDLPLLFILISSALLVLAVLTSLIAFRIGAPLLLLFLGIGLLVGVDGLGLSFDNAPVAYFIGSVALAVILFDSGFNTRFETASRALWPSLTLATVGVLLTTALVGVVVHVLGGLSWRASLLLGAIVSSTDAAAVFFLLRVGGIKIRERVRATLEVESGSNDPMAVFLTATLVDMIVAGPEVGAPLAAFLEAFVRQIGFGAVAGIGGGWLIATTINRLRLEPGLYPAIVLGMALLMFALVSLSGGSGFLTVYLAGMMTGNLGRQGMPLLRRFQDGLTWLSQIGMFLILGLLATPSEFGKIWVQGIVVALFLMLVARPLAVWLCLLPYRFTREETAFISWVGLRGAVSILLAILPMMAAIPAGQAFFNIAFIVVLTSMMLQGWTIRPVAKKLGLVVPPDIGPVEKVELELPGRATHELVAYHIVEDSPVATGERIPRWARPSLIVREGRSMKPLEAGPPRVGDYVYIFTAPRYIRLLDRLFASAVALDETDRVYFGDFALDGKASMADIAHEYGVTLPEDPGDTTLADFLTREFGSDPRRGDRIVLGPIELIVRDIGDDDDIETVGLSLAPVEPTRRRLPMFWNIDEIEEGLRQRYARWKLWRMAAKAAKANATDSTNATGEAKDAPEPAKIEARQDA
ncbi:potassium/proton antiporter [Microbaculum marinisediminis]|uniref:Potassium/proton antiporter n=1 Tax=Microbaculum marinisediminis TaxID=2931392 RepID=A0AAW5QX62_9HYPH|nr:potassium/proton antiporter [Microbaculum sp. A6E488]MCT8970993.1 potassium/proton antiporter [Microbaculum sp. A6E488]